MTIQNINPEYGDSIMMESVEEMENLVRESGYGLPEDGLKEGRDYVRLYEIMVLELGEDYNEHVKIFYPQQDVIDLESAIKFVEKDGFRVIDNEVGGHNELGEIEKNDEDGFRMEPIWVVTVYPENEG